MKNTVNHMFNEFNKSSVREIHVRMRSLYRSFKTDINGCIAMRSELKQRYEASRKIRNKTELSFIARKKCLYTINRCETYIRDTFNHDEYSITFKRASDMKIFMSKLSCTAGVIEVDSVVEVIVHRSNYSNMCCITGICSLSDGQTVLVDNKNKNLKLLDQKYEVVAHRSVVSGRPIDVCQVTPSAIVVTVNDDTSRTHQVQFLSVSKGRLQPRMKLQFQHDCVGIYHLQEELYITSYTALYKYTLGGHLIHKLHEDKSGDNTGKQCSGIMML
jgi:hypothetical protein